MTTLPHHIVRGGTCKIVSQPFLQLVIFFSLRSVKLGTSQCFCLVLIPETLAFSCKYDVDASVQAVQVSCPTALPQALPSTPAPRQSFRRVLPPVIKACLGCALAACLESCLSVPRAFSSPSSLTEPASTHCTFCYEHLLPG